MEHGDNRDMPRSRMQGMMKPSRRACQFLLPSKMTKEGRTIVTKRCTAYIPNFEVDEERHVCELCTVPDFLVREDRCRFFAPLEVTAEDPTTWRCAKSGKKWIEPGQCGDGLCPDYQKAEKNKWEIGRLEKFGDTAKPGPCSAEKPVTKAESDIRYRLIPKSQPVKKKMDNSQGGY